MGKYQPLRHFLESRPSSQVRMTFAEIEDVLGFALPEKSKLHRPWWSNNPDNNVMTREWLAAGYRSEQVDIDGEKIVFRKVTQPSKPPPDINHEPDPSNGQGGTSDADPLFGCMKDVTWVAPGVELTEPADPEWADLIEDPNWHP